MSEMVFLTLNLSAEHFPQLFYEKNYESSETMFDLQWLCRSALNDIEKCKASAHRQCAF